MAYYLKYILKNIEPLRISDDSKSEQGQTSSLNYISGSAVRGFVATKLADSGELESLKKEMFSDTTAFLNAYLSVNGKALVPSPKGFYEDKRIVEGEKDIQNVVISGDFDEGSKRAGLGAVSSLDLKSGLITYYNVKQNSELKIKLDKTNDMYRNAFIEPGQSFYGAIKSDSKPLLEKIEQILKDNALILGNSRSSGYGKCKVRMQPIDEAGEFDMYADMSGLSDYIYLYLVSDTVMRDDNGDYCGLDLHKIQENTQSGRF